MNTSQKIESLLFWKGEPYSHKKLAEILNVSIEEIKEAVSALRVSLEGRGVALVETPEEVSLVVAGEAAGLIEQITKEELDRDLGKAALETLAIVLYQGPLRRSDIDYIRGVNSQFILRNLLVRGLIEKEPDPKDQRTFIYKPSLELLQHLGISTLEDMPEYNDIRSQIEGFKLAKDEYVNKE